MQCHTELSPHYNVPVFCRVNPVQQPLVLILLTTTIDLFRYFGWCTVQLCISNIKITQYICICTLAIKGYNKGTKAHSAPLIFHKYYLIRGLVRRLMYMDFRTKRESRFLRCLECFRHFATRIFTMLSLLTTDEAVGDFTAAMIARTRFQHPTRGKHCCPSIYNLSSAFIGSFL